MAYQFNGSTHVIKRASAPISGYPITMFGRIRLLDFTVTTSNHSIVKLATASLGWGYQLTVENVSSAWKARAFSAVATGNSATTTNAIADNNWHTAIGEWTSDTARQVWLDNGGNASNSGSTAPGTPTRTILGANENTGGSLAANVGHEIADVAVWAGTLTAADRAALQAGISPALVRPDILVGYWPGLVGANDWRSSPFTTITGATAVPGPRVYMPAPSRIIGVPSAICTGTGSGSIGLTGSATAKVKIQASGSGSLPLTGSGTESEKVKGTASSALPLSGSATATVKVRCSASGVLPLSGAASSKAAIHAIGSGTLGFTATANGKVPVRGAANDNLGLFGACSGRVVVRGIAAGTLDLSGSALSPYGHVFHGQQFELHPPRVLRGSVKGTHVKF